MTDPRSTWRPTAALENLRARAEVLAEIRGFFAAREVLEVQTPLLSGATVTDLHLHSVTCEYRGPGAADGRTLYLQTSPEFAMKRLLAAGSGAIYQICTAVRDGEAGRRHNPEFTMLEWYRPGFDHHRLMDEIDELMAEVLGLPPAGRLTYHEAFVQHARIAPHTADGAELARCARDHGIAQGEPLTEDDRDGWLALLMSHVVEPRLGRGRPDFVVDYPASQAALARVRPGDPPVAERFELYIEGTELANGFHELNDPAEQRLRFERDLAARREAGLPAVPVDGRLLAALEAGLPDCAGVALGIDRLVMLGTHASRIDEVIAFPIDRA